MDRNASRGQHWLCQIKSQWLALLKGKSAMYFANSHVTDCDLLINICLARIVMRTPLVMQTKEEEIQDRAEHFDGSTLMNAFSD